jgi:5-methylcytosine-specific restriction endonuclease McrA
MKRSTLNHLSKKKCYQNMLTMSSNNDPICVDRCSDCEFPHYYSVKKRTVINPISKKKRKEIQSEIPIRKQLRERADGCCEHCGQHPDFRGLHPHEKVFRSHGGRLTMSNSEMWCGRCHAVDGHNLREVKDI